MAHYAGRSKEVTYRYRIETEAKRRFLDLLKERFNSPVQYRGKMWQWDTIIFNKVQELSRFLIGKSESIDLSEPQPSLKRSDDRDIRRQILELGQKQAEELGIDRSTLHYLRRHVESDRTFRLYNKVACRLK